MSAQQDTSKVARLYDNLIKSGKITEKELGDKQRFVGAVKNYESATKLYNILSGSFSKDEIGTETEFYSFIRPDIERQPSDAEAILSRVQGKERDSGGGSVAGMIYNKLDMEGIWNRAGEKAKAKTDEELSASPGIKMPQYKPLETPQLDTMPDYDQVRNGAKMDTSAISGPAKWNPLQPMEEEMAANPNIKEDIERELSEFKAKNGEFLNRYREIQDKIETPSKEKRMRTGDQMQSPIELFRDINVARNLSSEEKKYYDDHKKQFDALSNELRSLQIRKDNAELVEQLGRFSHTKSFTGKMWDGIVNSGLAKDFASFGITELSRNMTVMRALDKANKEGMSALEDHEKKLVQSFMHLKGIQSEERGGWYTTGQMTREMMPFIASMIGTAGIHGWGMQAAKGLLGAANWKAASALGKKAMFKFALGKAGQMTLANMVRTPFTPTFYTNLGQKRIEDFSMGANGEIVRNDDTLGGDIYRAFVENTMEYLAEGLGEHMGLGFLNRFINKKRAASVAVNNIFKTIDKVTDNPLYKDVAKVLDKAQIQGIPQEGAEEMITALSTSALTGSEDYKQLKEPWFYYSIAINTALLGGAGMGAKFAAGGTSHLINKGVVASQANKSLANHANAIQNFTQQYSGNQSSQLANLANNAQLAVEQDQYTEGSESALEIINQMGQIVENIPDTEAANKQAAQELLQATGDMVTKNAMKRGMYDGIITKMEESLGGDFVYKKNPKQVLILTNSNDESFYLIDKTEPEIGKPVYVVRNTQTGESSTLTEADIKDISQVETSVFVEEWMKNADLQAQGEVTPENPAAAEDPLAPVSPVNINEPIIQEGQEIKPVNSATLKKGDRVILAGYPVQVMDITDEGVIVFDERNGEHMVEISDLYELPTTDVQIPPSNEELPPPPADMMIDGQGGVHPYTPPSNEKGEVDYDSMEPDMLLSELTKEFGPEGAVSFINEQIEALNEQREKLSKKKVTSISDAVKLKKQISEISTKIEGLTNAIKPQVQPQVQPQAPAEMPAPAVQQAPITQQPEVITQPQPKVSKKRDPKARVTKTPFREDMESLGDPMTPREYIAWKLMTGTKLRMSDLTSDTGGVIARGVAAHLGLRGRSEKRRYIGLMDNKNGLTPEQLAHEIWEEAQDSGIFAGMDDMDILDTVLEVLPYTYSKRSALDFMMQERKATSASTQIDVEQGQQEYEDRKRWEIENGTYQMQEDEINEIIDDLYQESFVALTEQEHDSISQAIANIQQEEEYQQLVDSFDDLPEDIPQNDTRENTSTGTDRSGTSETIQGSPAESSKGENSEQERDNRGSERRDSENASSNKNTDLARQGSNELKQGKTPIDDEIEALENARKEAIAERNRLIKNNTERNGLFGDTKEVEPDDIFSGEGFDPSASQPLVDKQNNLIETLEGKIAKLKQSKETGIKENAGQLDITDKEVQGNQSKPESRFKPPKETTDTTPETKPQDEFGKNNKLFTEEAALAAIARLKASLGNLNSGFNPQTAFDALQVGGYLIEGGARKFADYAKKMIELIGDAIKPYIKMSYMSVMKYPGMERFEKEMDSYDYVTNFNLEEINKDNVSDSKKDLVDSQNDTESKNTQKPKDNDTSRGTQTEDSSLGREKRPETEESDTRGVDTSSKGDIRPNGVGSGRVSGLSNSTERRKGSSEVKRNQSNNRGERGVNYAPASPKARFNANIEAIKLLRTLQDQGVTIPTTEQMAVLRKYSGWGGLGTYFNNQDTPENNILKEILSADEYSTAELSLNSAYFTPASVIDSLWDVAKSLGFEGGKVLESSAGVGSILGNMPQGISNNSDIQAVEIDLISGGILKLLYPDANVTIGGFEEANIPSGTVDLAITNVPFVTGLSVYDNINKDLTRKFKNIHDFFIAKNIRALKEGGIGIFITSSGTLDKSRKLREWIGTDGTSDVIGAFRLNNETFEGTGVTSDIIIVRKRIGGKVSPEAIDVMSTTIPRVHKEDTGKRKKNKTTGELEPVYETFPLEYNAYFAKNPQNMGGEMSLGLEKGNTYRGTSAGLFPSPNINQEQALADWAKSLSPQEKAKQAEQDKNQDTQYEATEAKEGTLLFNSKGVISNARNGRAIPNEKINTNKVKGRSKIEVLRDYNRLKSAVDRALEYQLNNEEDSGLDKFLKDLNNAYDSFVSKYGAITKNLALSFLRYDADFPSVVALEKYREETTMDGKKIVTIEKQDIFRSRVIGRTKELTPTTITDGVITSIHKYNTIKTDYIAEALGMEEGAVLAEMLEQGLAFIDPQTGGLEVRHEYLSGNVREKHALASDLNENGKYNKNIAELEKVIPMDIPAHLIEFTLGSRWIPAELYENFFKEAVDARVRITNDGAGWNVEYINNQFNEKSRSYGVKSEVFDEVIYGHLILEAAMSNRSITVSKTQKNPDGTTETVHDREATQVCATRMSEIKDQFKEWARERMLEDSQMSDRITRIYNDKHNCIVPVSISNDFLPKSYPGMNLKVTLYDHQRRAAMKAMTAPLMLAHEVGTGKTFTLITTAMEMRRLGTAKKPMIVVQNATLGQFLAEAKLLYPNSKVLTIADADKTPTGRREFYAKIKYGDWDMIIIPQSMFSMIPDSKEREARFIEEKIAEKLEVLDRVKERGDDSNTARNLQKEIDKLTEELSDVFSPNKDKKSKDAKGGAKAAENAASRAKETLDRKVDDVEDFDQMDIDALLIDEAHNYKRLGFATTMSRIKGIDSNRSKRSASTFLKAQAVMEKTGWKNVVFATGTPISNTAAEIWTFMKYLTKKEELKDNDIYNFDDFVANFGNVKQMVEFTTSGKLKENIRFASYVNMPELIRLWANVSDTVLTKDIVYVSDQIPELETGAAQDMMLPQSRSLIEIMNAVKTRLKEFEEMTGKEKKENSHIPLVMYGIAKRAAIDPRLVAKNAKYEPLSKTGETVRQTLRSLKETSDYKGTVAIFCDNFQRKENKVATFNLFKDIKARLIEEGVPESQIVIIESGMTVPKKKKIFEDINSGNIRVVMGSTSTLGTGVNIQERLHTLIHMDAPDRPMDYTQRNGRILRQGNMHRKWNKKVRVIRFGVEDSLDVTGYQRLKTKAAFIDSVMDGKTALSNIFENRILEEEEDGLFDNMLAVISGSQYAILKNKAEREQRKLSSKKKQHNADQVYIHSKLRENQAKIERLEKVVANNKKSYDIISKSVPGGKVEKMKIEGEVVNNNEAEIDLFFKEKINTKVNEYIEKARDNAYFREGTISFNVQIADLKFVIDVDIVKHSEYDTERKLSKTTMKRAVKLSSEQLGIDRDHVFGAYPKEAIKAIMEQYVDGSSFLSTAEKAENDIKATIEENRLMNERKGKPFALESELKESEELVKEYTRLMMIELQEKEEKYKNVESEGLEVDQEVEEDEESDSDNDDDDDVVFRDSDEVTSEEEQTLYRFIGKGGAERLDRSQGVKTRIQSLELAQQMEDLKEDASKIRLITGWERGIDNNWKFEISGGKIINSSLDEIKFKNRQKTVFLSYKNQSNFDDAIESAVELQYVWDHKEMYRAYPELKKVPILLTIDPSIKSGGPGEIGTYIHRSPDYENGAIVVTAGTAERASYVLVHEIQHAIQFSEGFALGMSRETASAVRKKSNDELYTETLLKQAEEYARKVEAIIAYKGEISPEEHSAVIDKTLKGDSLSFVSEQIAEGVTTSQLIERAERFAKYQRDANYQYYRSTVGEIEARAASDRMNMTPSERRTTTILESEDTQRSQANIFTPEDYQTFSDKYNAKFDQLIEVDSKQRPAIDSNGDLIDSATGEIESFWRWFGKSKTVDSEGAPLTLYHGTPTNGIKEFDVDKSGSNVQADFGAIFFTDSPRLADDFSYERLPSDTPFMHTKGAKGEVHKARIKMEKPFDLRNMTEEMAEILIREGAIVPVETILRDAVAPNKELVKSHLPFDMSQLAKYGYDGVIGNLNQYGATEYAVFSNDNVRLIKENDKPFKKAGIKETESTKKSAQAYLEADNTTYSELKPEDIPQKTQTAYKLMKYYKSSPGILYPLYAKDADTGKKGFAKGKWYKAEQQSVEIGGKQLANRPGIHAVDLPLFLQGKANVKGETRVWVKVEMPAMNEKTQADNDNSEQLSNGQKAGIRDRLIGPDEAYNFKTNPAATAAGSWPIAGSMKIVEVLSDEKVAKILTEAGKGEFVSASMTGDPEVIFRKQDKAQAREQEIEEMRAAAKLLSATLGVPVRIITNVDEIPEASARKRKAKGWYSPKQDAIVIVIPNHSSVDDVRATIMHEAVGHKGLRGLLGERFNATMERVYHSLPKGARATYLAKYGDFVTAAEEYLSELAEQEIPVSTWNKIKAIIKEAFRAMGIDLKFSDADMAFMLWRSKNRLKSSANQTAIEVMNSVNEESRMKERFREQFEQKEAAEDELFRDDDFDPNSNDIKLSKTDIALEAIQDRMIAGKRLIEEVQRRGGSVGTFANFYSEEVRSSSRARFELDQFTDKYFAPITNLIKDWSSKYGYSINEIEDYMIAKHAPERNREIVSSEVYNSVLSAQKTELKRLQSALMMIEDEKVKADLIKSIEIALTRMQIMDESGRKIAKSIYDEIILGEGKYEAPDNLTMEESMAYADIIASIKPKMKNILKSDNKNNRSGMLEDEAEQIVSEFESVIGASDAVKFWERVNAATRYTTEKAEGYDLISMEDRERYENMYQYYVPLRGWRVKEEIDYEGIFGEGYQGHEILNKVKKSAKGRQSLAGNVLGNIASMAESTIASGSKNEVRKSAWRMVVANKEMKDLFLVKETWALNVAPENQEPEWILVNEPPLQSLIDKGIAKRVADDKTYEERKTKAELTKHQVPVYINGARIVVEFKGELGARVASAINGENIAHMNGKLAQSISAMTRTMAALRTSKNPDFMLTNFVRDFFFGNMAYYVRGGNPAKLNANLGRVFKAIHNGIAESDQNTYLATMYNDFREAGGQTGYVHLYGEERHQKKIEKMLREAQESASVSPKIYARKTVKGINSALDYMAHMSEDAMRFAVYLTEVEQLMKDEGADTPSAAMMKKAALAAKEATVNFNRKGKYTTLINSLYAFFNASVQGTANYLSLAKENPARFIKAHIAILALRTALHALWSLMYGDDDDDEKTYSEINDYVKENNLVFLLGNGRFVTLPLPHAARALTNIGPLMVDVINKRTKPGEAIDTYMKNIISEVSPINLVGLDKSAYIPATFKELLLSVSPTVIRPIAEVALNTDYQNRPIERENFLSTDDRYLPRHKKAYANTNSVLVGASKFINKAAGGNDERTAGLHIDDEGNVSRSNIRAMADISPAYIEHIIEGYLGGVGRFVNDSYKTARSIAKFEAPKLQNIPVLRRFYQEPFESLGWQKYYEIRSRVNDIENAKEAAMKVGVMSEFTSINNMYNNSIVVTYDVYNKQIQDLSRLRKELPKEDARIGDIDKRINDVMNDLASSIKEIDKKFNNKK